MEKAIKIAMDNGYKPREYDVRFEHARLYSGKAFTVSYQDCYLDPLFWQSLGKGLGWKGNQKKIRTKDNGQYAKIRYSPEEYTEYGTNWLNEWHLFIDHLAEGKDIEGFFTDLLN